jgi:excisionase family DNA binding protein
MGKSAQKNERPLVPLADRLSLSPEEASALTGIGTTRIREAVDARVLKAHKHGTRTIILPDDLKVWLRSMPPAGKSAETVEG